MIQSAVCWTNMSCVFILLPVAHKAAEASSGVRGSFLEGKRRLKQPFDGDPIPLEFTVKPVGHQLCSPYSVLIRGLIRLSPRMFASYLSAANFPQAKCSNWAILFQFKRKRGPIMRDFSFMAPTAGSLARSPFTLGGQALRGRTVLTPGMSASICHPWVWGAGHGVGDRRSTLPVIDVAYSSVFPCFFPATVAFCLSKWFEDLL